MQESQTLIKLLDTNHDAEPGGYLQWEEPNDDASKRPIVKADPSNSSENAEKLLQKMDARFRAKTPASYVYHSCNGLSVSN